MKGTLQFQDFRLSTSSPSALARAIDNPPTKLGASKHPKPRASKITATVHYRDIFGKVHSIECGNKSQIAKARKFFDMFRDEHLAILTYMNGFPRNEDGMIPKKYHSEVRKALKEVWNFRTADANWIIENY
jgi:hypothetical protein